MNSEENKIDYGLILTVFLLFVFSVITIYSTTVLINGGSAQATILHVIWYILGAISIAVIMQLDAKLLWRLTPIAYGVAVILLIAVLFLYDRQTAAVSGARSWFRFGPVSFQPAEIAKIALILALSKVVTQHNTKYRTRKYTTDRLLLLKIIATALPLILLIILENDLGTTLVMAAITVGIILMSGITPKILIPLFGGMFLIGASLIYLTIEHRDLLLSIGFKNYQFARIDSWLSPFTTGGSGSYQVRNAITAIASGGVFGKGFGVSQVHVPVRESDMIFTTIAENFGFIGSFTLLILYFVLIYQMIRMCFEIKIEFYTYISVGVVAMITFHVFENVGMNIGLLPLTGIPLPFISQGGSALLVNMIGIGLLMAMRYQNENNLKLRKIVAGTPKNSRFSKKYLKIEQHEMENKDVMLATTTSHREEKRGLKWENIMNKILKKD